MAKKVGAFEWNREKDAFITVVRGIFRDTNASYVTIGGKSICGDFDSAAECVDAVTRLGNLNLWPGQIVMDFGEYTKRVSANSPKYFVMAIYKATNE